MKKIFFIIFFLIESTFVFSQKNGQDFCVGDLAGDYFPLEIVKKKIFWYNTYYYETSKGVKLINGKEYIEFEQKWEKGNIDTLYLRKQEDSIIEFEECCKTESLRFSESKIIGFEWERKEREIVYTIESKNAKLKTPFCKYENLLVLRAKYKDGTVYDFYYLKGLGYVGATEKGKLISCITPEM